jgi:hypothetical protein
MHYHFLRAGLTGAILATATAASADTETFFGGGPFTVTASGIMNQTDVSGELFPISGEGNALAPLAGTSFSFSGGFDVDFNNASSVFEGDNPIFFFQQEDLETAGGFEVVLNPDPDGIGLTYSANSLSMEINDDLPVTFLQSIPFLDPSFTFEQDPEASFDVVTISVESFGSEDVLETTFFAVFENDLYTAPGTPVLDFATLAAGPLTTAMQVQLLAYEAEGGAPDPNTILGAGYYEYTPLLAAFTLGGQQGGFTPAPSIEFGASTTPPVVPVPATLPLLLAGMGALGYAARRKRATA